MINQRKLILYVVLLGIVPQLTYAKPVEISQESIQRCQSEIGDCVSEIRSILTLAQNVADVIQELDNRLAQIEQNVVSVNDYFTHIKNSAQFYEMLSGMEEQCHSLLRDVKRYAARSVVQGKIYSLPQEFIDAGFGFEDLDIQEPFSGLGSARVSSYLTPEGETKRKDRDSLANLKSNQLVFLPGYQVIHQGAKDYIKTELASMATDAPLKNIYFQDGKYVIEYENGYSDSFEIQGKQLIGTLVTPQGSTTESYTYVSREDRIQRAIQKYEQSNPKPKLAEYEYSRDDHTLIKRGVDGSVTTENLTLPTGVDIEVRDGHYVILKDNNRGLVYGDAYMGMGGGSIALMGSRAIESETGEVISTSEDITFGNNMIMTGSSVQNMIDLHVSGINARAARRGRH